MWLQKRRRFEGLDYNVGTYPTDTIGDVVSDLHSFISAVSRQGDGYLAVAKCASNGSDPLCPGANPTVHTFYETLRTQGNSPVCLGQGTSKEQA